MKNSYYGQLNCRASNSGFDQRCSFYRASALLVHNLQSVCSREYMRNSLQYNLRNVCSIRLVCVVRLQFAVAKQTTSREAHERVGLIISKIRYPRHILGMLQLLLTEAIRHAHYTSDTIKIHLKYGGLIKQHRTLERNGKLHEESSTQIRIPVSRGVGLKRQELRRIKKNFPAGPKNYDRDLVIPSKKGGYRANVA